MSIQRIEPSPASTAALREGLALVTDRGSPFVAMREGAGPAAPAGYRHFVMTAQNLADGAMPRAVARLYGWRYIVHDQAGFAMATVADVESPRFADYNVSEYSRATAGAVRSATAIAESRDEPYEIRFLSIPPLHVETAWLAGAGDAVDVLIPFGRVPQGVETATAYPATELLALLYPVAVRLLEIGRRTRL